MSLQQDWPSFLSEQGINNLQDLEDRFGIITEEFLEMMVENGSITEEQSNIILQLVGLGSSNSGSTLIDIEPIESSIIDDEFINPLGEEILPEDIEEDVLPEENVEEGNPIVEVNLTATEDDRFFFFVNSEQQYTGSYHRHEDGTLMIGVGELGVNHQINQEEIIFRKAGYAQIQETREVVSDLFYKLWFQSNTLSQEEILSMQTTIRDGIKQTGRTEDEPLVFYKKDRNTLESRKDLQGEVFEELCQYIFENQLDNLDSLFSIESSSSTIDEQTVTEYKINFDNSRFTITIAKKVGETFTDVLNLSQLTKTKAGQKIDAEKAREVLDTDIFELLPNQRTRQDTINDFFQDFNELIGPKPAFFDIDDDGVGESPQNYESDEQNRISYENQSAASITRLNSQANELNQGKTLESMRNTLNTYLGDVDNVITNLEDQRPEYENKSSGFLKIRKPNQAIIITSQHESDMLEFQRNDSFLADGFTITMWVRFLSKSNNGTLFSFGNPQSNLNPYGFKLETFTIKDANSKYRRMVRLVVRNHITGEIFDSNLPNPNSITTENKFKYNTVENNAVAYRPGSTDSKFFNHTLIPTDNLEEWFFICATYNPQINESFSFIQSDDLKSQKLFWLNHMNLYGAIVADASPYGARCKVEVISRSDLLRARGFKVEDLGITSEQSESQEASQETSTQQENNQEPPIPNIMESGAYATETGNTEENSSTNQAQGSDVVSGPPPGVTTSGAYSDDY